MNHATQVSREIRCKVRTFLAEAEFSRVAARHEDGDPFSTNTIRQLASQALLELAPEVEQEDSDRLLCINARLNFIDNRQGEALESLCESTSPFPFRFRLIMLQELGRFGEADALLEDMEPSLRWADVAIPIRFLSGHEDKAADIEELKKLLLARGKFLRELRCMVTSGRCTVSSLAMQENRPLVQEMILRSRPMAVLETEEHHGRFVTYASNGVILSPGNSGFYEATDPMCPPPESQIVIDPTSVLTLHRLGLLETALTRFEHVRVPGQLISRFVEVIENLQPHECSSCDAMLEVERLLISGSIRTVPVRSGEVIVEFDGEADQEGIGVRHVINWLHGNGQLAEDDFRQLQPVESYAVS